MLLGSEQGLCSTAQPALALETKDPGEMCLGTSGILASERGEQGVG